MTPQAYFQALRKRWWLIAGIALLLAAGGFVNAKTTTPMYASSASSYVTLSQAGSISELAQGSTYTQNLMESFALLATTPTVLDPVIDELDLDTTSTRLANTLTASVPLNSFVIEVRATSADAQEAAAVADGVATELATVVQRLAPNSADGGASVRLETVAPAVVPNYPYEPNTRLEVMIWGAGGVVLGVLAALVWALADTRVRRVGDIEAAAGIPVLGSIPKYRKPTRRAASRPEVGEAFRRVRVNLAFLDADRDLNAIVITSPSAGEGKTTAAIALARALAEVQSRVLLIDCDLRKPTVAEQTGTLADAGLTNILVGQATIEEMVQPSADLDILTSGPVPPNPSQLVEGLAMEELISAACESYDYVVIDSPPVLPVVDASVLARRVGGALIVARAGRTTRQKLGQAAQSLRAAIDAEAVGGIFVGTHQAESYYGAPVKKSRRRGDFAG